MAASDFTARAHSRPRIAFHADITGKEITTKLLQAVRKLDNVQISAMAMTDILTGERDGATVCTGVIAVPVDEDDSPCPADELVNAAGACMPCRRRFTPAIRCGRRAASVAYTTTRPTTRSSRATPATSPRSTVCMMSTRDHVQIHPTGLFSPQPAAPHQRELLHGSDSAQCRRRAFYRRACSSRDRDSSGIRAQMKQDGNEHEWLSCALVERDVTGHFANIRACCRRTVATSWTSPFPLRPRSTTMGGVWVDKDGRTLMPELYAAGETACNGVHGKNRPGRRACSKLAQMPGAAWYAYRRVTGRGAAGDPALDGRHRALERRHPGNR